MKAVITSYMLLLAVTLAVAQVQPADLKLYGPEQIATMTVEDLFARLSRPESGYQTNAARFALVVKAQVDAQTKQQITSAAIEAANGATRAAFERSQAMYVLAALADPATVPVLTKILTGQDATAIRSAAACALGQMQGEEAAQALKQARDGERDAEVLKWIDRGLQAKPTAVAEPQNAVRFWLVKDWLRLRNGGPPAMNVEFQRFFPVVDDEQIVLGRWIEACDARTRANVPVSLLKVEPDNDQNLIHTIRLAGMQQNQEVTVTVTAVVARHARPAPTPPYALLKPEAYPDWARPYLAATPTVPANDPLVRQHAQQLLANSKDAYDILVQIVALLKELPSPPTQRWGSHPELSTPAFVLKYGGVANQGAVTCAALCRACGIPAQLTYYPGQSLMAVVDAYLPGYGWFRVQPAFAAAFVPQLGFAPPRVLNLPLEAETQSGAYLQPFHTAADNSWQVYTNGQPTPSIRSWNAVENGKRVLTDDAIPHYESGMALRALGSEPFEGGWLAWDDLSKLSMEQVTSLQTGTFAVEGKVQTIKALIERGLNYKDEGVQAATPQQEGQPALSRPARQ